MKRQISFVSLIFAFLFVLPLITQVFALGCNDTLFMVKQPVYGCVYKDTGESCTMQPCDFTGECEVRWTGDCQTTNIPETCPGTAVCDQASCEAFDDGECSDNLCHWTNPAPPSCNPEPDLGYIFGSSTRSTTFNIQRTNGYNGRVRTDQGHPVPQTGTGYGFDVESYNPSTRYTVNVTSQPGYSTSWQRCFYNPNLGVYDRCSSGQGISVDVAMDYSPNGGGRGRVIWTYTSGPTPTNTPVPPTPTTAVNRYRISGRYINIGLSPTPAPNQCGTAVGDTDLNGYQVNLYPQTTPTFTADDFQVPPTPGAFNFFNVPDHATYSLDGDTPNGLNYICAYSPTTPGGSTTGVRPTIAVNGANVSGVKYVFGEPTPIPTVITPPVSTPTPAPWRQLRASSFQINGAISQTIPAAPKHFEGGPGDNNFITDSNAGVVTAQSINLGIANPQAAVSVNRWKIDNGYQVAGANAPDLVEYIKAKKEYVPLSVSDGLSSIQSGKVNIFSGEGQLSITTANDVQKIVSKAPVVIVLDGINMVINLPRDTNFNAGTPPAAIAIIAVKKGEIGGNITFGSDVKYANGIFITNNKVITSINPANPDLGLSIQGNLIAANLDNAGRKWQDNNRPSLYVIQDVNMYMSLIGLLTKSTYDWQQLK